MRVSVINSSQILDNNLRISPSLYLSDSENYIRTLKLHNQSKLGTLLARTPFAGSRTQRIYVQDRAKGIPYLSNADMLLADPLSICQYISKKNSPFVEKDQIKYSWTLISGAGTIGLVAYVTHDLDNSAASSNIIRLVPSNKIHSGYLYAYMSSPLGVALLKGQASGRVQDFIDPNVLGSLPVCRLEIEQEEHIHQLIEQASQLRMKANRRLSQTQERFYRQVLGLNQEEIKWQCRNEHSYSTGSAHITSGSFRLDAFYYVGYVEEAEQKLGKTISMGDLVEPYQPSQFKRPYTGKTGTPLLSGIDLFNTYPKPRAFISSKMKNLTRYLVPAGTILVQSDGSRDGLIARPTILPKHLNNCAVTQHMARLYPKDARDRGYVFTWLSTDIGRRLLLKHSSGSVMGSLFEQSYRDARIPDCSQDLRYTFEEDIKAIIEMREKANEIEENAQALISEYLQFGS